MDKTTKPAKRPKADLYKLQNVHKPMDDIPDLEEDKPRREEKGRRRGNKK